jgi:two-component system sensor histidine kinase VicK
MSVKYKADENDTMPGLHEGIFRILFEKSPGSLVVKADMPRFTIIAASDAYLQITGSIAESILGKGFFDVFPEDNAKFNDDVNARKVFAKVVKTGKKVDVPTYRFDVYNPDKKVDEVRYWSCLNTPIPGADGNVAYILNTVVDITEEVKAKESAMENENRLRLATEAAALATWDLSLVDHSFICAPRLGEIFGHAAGEAFTLANIRSQVNANDMKNIILRAYTEAMKTGNYLYEVRIYWPDGSMHWIKTQGIVIYDDNKRPIRMLGTLMDITESKRDEIRKNDFIAMASHELKTPLTSLKAYLQMLSKKMTDSNDAFVKNALEKANYQVNKMTDLIYGFLDLSKLEAGKLQLNKEVFDMNKLIADTIAETNLTMPGNNIKFDQGDSVKVNADRDKICQVISNFLSNAIKYSNKGTAIVVNCAKSGADVIVSVKDKGIGIKLKDQEKLFQRFYRVESEKMKNISGFGIGLYLSGEIIQRHKGKIWAASEEGKGATFYFSLPLTQ